MLNARVISLLSNFFPSAFGVILSVALIAASLNISVLAQDISSDQNLESIDSLMAEYYESYFQISQRIFEEGRRMDSKEGEDLFFQCFGDALSQNFGTVHDDGLRALHTVLGDMLREHPDSPTLEHFIEVSEEIGRRGLENKDERAETYAQETYNVLVGARKFEQADDIANSYPNKVERLPYAFPEAGSHVGASILKRDPGTNRYVTSPVDINNGRWFVGVVHTSCPFSEMAMKYIESHPEKYASLLPENTIWVVSQRYTEILSYLERWNSQSEIIDIHVAYEDKLWPNELILLATPLFYLIEDGQVIDRLNGWPDDTKAKELDAMLRSMDEVDLQ